MNYAIMRMILTSFCFILMLYLEFILRIVSSLFISLTEGKFVLSRECDFSVEMYIFQDSAKRDTIGCFFVVNGDLMSSQMLDK